MEELIQKKAKKLLEKVTLFDVYRDEKLGENKKSVAYSLTFRVADRTLKDEEVQKVLDDICAKLEKEFGVKLRK